MIFVDVDDFLSLIDVCERNRPVGSNRFVVVDRTLVVTVVQSSWADKRIDFALVQAVYDRFNNDANVVALRFLKESNATGHVIRK